jgi:non-ribosomal peptide synthetase component F
MSLAGIAARQNLAALVPIGRPIANTRIHILGDQQELLPVGATGEIWIAGVQVGLGYFGRARTQC